MKFEFPAAQYRKQQGKSSLWERGLQGEQRDLRQGKPAQNDSAIVGITHKIFKDRCVKRGKVISHQRNDLMSGKSTQALLLEQTAQQLDKSSTQEAIFFIKTNST